MKFRNLNLFLAAGVLAAGAVPAMAQDATDVKISTFEASGENFRLESEGGGEFKLTGVIDEVPGLYGGVPVQNVSDAEAMTFCLEVDEYFNPGELYKADIGDAAVATTQTYLDGNYGGTPDPISNQTAYLYEHFVFGTLGTSYDYSHTTRDTDAWALQNAIWYFEDEITSVSGKAKDFVDEADDAVANGYTNDKFDGNGYVAVLNPYLTSVRNDDQSQLIYIVPTPTSVLAGTSAMGVLGVAYFFRRRRQMAA
jgi:hypothetical protein